MTINLEQLKATIRTPHLAREMAEFWRTDHVRRQALAQRSSIAGQIKELAGMSTEAAQIGKAMNASHAAMLAMGQQHQRILAERSTAMSAVTRWHGSQRAQQERIRKMLEPLANIQKASVLSRANQKLVNEFVEATSIQRQVKDVFDQSVGIGSAAKLCVQQMEEALSHAKKGFENVQAGRGIRTYLESFEKVNKRWAVANEVLGVAAPLRELQDQISRITLPTIDRHSAAILAQILARDGIEEQLSRLGIESDGSLDFDKSRAGEKGLFNRKQQDIILIIALLLTILIPLYQEYSNLQQEAKTEAFQARTEAFEAHTAETLKVQSRQIQSLGALIERALAQPANEPDDTFVVRTRRATVRANPKHGATVEAMLLPNEVVLRIDRKGKWIEVEYYNLLRKEFRTGWVLKKYLQRMSAIRVSQRDR